MSARGGGKLVIHGAKPPGAFHLIKILYIVLLCWRCLLIRTDTDAHCARCSSQFAFFPSKAPLRRSHPSLYSFYALTSLPPSFHLLSPPQPHPLPSDLPPWPSGLWESRLNGPLGILALSLDSLCSHPGCFSSTAACTRLLSVPSPPTSSPPSVAQRR